MYPYTKRFLKEYLPGKGKVYFWGILFLLITIVTTAVLPNFTKDAINHLTKSQHEEFLFVSILILSLGIVLCIFRTLSRIFIFLQGRRIEAEVRQDLFNSVVNLPMNDLAQYQSGDLISRGTNDVTSIRVMISMGILHTINTGLIVPLCLYQMFSISPKLTLICLIPLPLAIIGTKFLSNKMMLAGRDTQKQLGVLSETIREQFRAHTMLSIFPVFERVNEQFTKDNSSYSQKAESLLRIRVCMMIMVATILSLGMFILLRYGGPEAIANEELGKNGFNIGAFTAFGLFLGMMQGPLRSAGFLLPLLQRGEVCLERIYDVRDTAFKASETDAKREVQSIDYINSKDAPYLISISDLKYSYNENNPESFSLNIKELNIQQGKKYGIFGKTGCGKTTLANIICANIRTEGINCKNIPYSKISSSVLNSLFSIVPQDNKHFSKTIQENIDLVIENSKGNENALSFEDSYEVSQLKYDVEEFNDGLNTLLGEHGINLSGGQKQRLSILRALVKPRDLLIMDDYVSAVDHKTESRIITKLFEKIDGQTVLLISHRISALTPCDEIIVMENGQIVDQGSHDHLYKNNKEYKETYDHQMLEKKLEELL